MPHVVLDLDKRVPTKQPHHNFGVKHSYRTRPDVSLRNKLGLSDSAKAKIRASRIGRKMSIETKEKIRQANIKVGRRPPSPLGRKLSEQTLAKMRAHPNYRLGKKHTEAALAKQRAAKLGKKWPPEFGRAISAAHSTPEARTANSARQRALHPVGTRKIDLEPYRSNNIVEVKEWRKAVLVRDDFTCQHCRKRGGNYLEAHHIKPWAKFPELRFDVDNGIILCKPCHKAEHKRMRAEEIVMRIAA